ncbi:MAG: type II CAAX prenyl endopeptidase Rce1 family protein [Halococcoides sp.]
MDALGADDKRLVALAWGALAVVVATILVGLVFAWSQLLSVVVALGATLLGLPVLVRFALLLLVGELLAYAAVSVVIAVGSRRLGRPIVRIRVPTLFDLLLVTVGSILSIGILYSFSLLMVWLGIDAASHNIAELGQQSPFIFLIGAVLSIPVIGLSEELFFRGVVQDLLGEATPRSVAVVVASVLFAVPHLLSYLPGEDALTVAAFQSAAVSLTMLFVIGLVLGAIYEASDNVVVPAVVHGVFNGFQFLIAFLVTIVGIDQFALL